MNQSHTSLPLPGFINKGWRIGIVHSTFHSEDSDKLVESAEELLRSAGITSDKIQKYPVPGSFEIPLIGNMLAAQKNVEALIGLGIIVKGETRHAELVADQTATGIMRVQMEQQIPFAFEILVVDSIDQARARLDRGADAARAVLHSLALLWRIRY